MSLHIFTKEVSLFVPRESIRDAFADVIASERATNWFLRYEEPPVREAIENKAYRIAALLENEKVPFSTNSYNLCINSGQSDLAYEIIVGDAGVLKSNGCLSALLFYGGTSFVSDASGIHIIDFDVDSYRDSFFDFLEALAPYVSRDGLVRLESEEGDAWEVVFDGKGSKVSEISG